MIFRDSQSGVTPSFLYQYARHFVQRCPCCVSYLGDLRCEGVSLCNVKSWFLPQPKHIPCLLLYLLFTLFSLFSSYTLLLHSHLIPLPVYYSQAQVFKAHLPMPPFRSHECSQPKPIFTSEKPPSLLACHKITKDWKCVTG